MKAAHVLERITHNWPAKAMSVAAAALLFLFHRIGTLEERMFSVPINIIVDEELAPANLYPRTARLTVRGDKDHILHISEDDIEVYADFSRHKHPGVFREPVLVRKSGEDLSSFYTEIMVEPLEILMNLEEKARRLVNVQGHIHGFPDHGYELGQYFIEPEQILIEGPRSIVDQTESISTQIIDISGATESINRIIQLTPPDPNIQVPGNQAVRFSAVIQEAMINRTWDPVSIILFDLHDDLRIVSWLPTGSVRVQGSLLQVDHLGSDDVILSGDASIMDQPGAYNIPLRPVVPEGVVVLGFSPQAISVTVSSTGDGP